MAVAGGMTSAYQFVIEDFTLKTVKATTYPRQDCANVEAAVAILERGEHCIVAAGDVAKLRQRLARYRWHAARIASGRVDACARTSAATCQ